MGAGQDPLAFRLAHMHERPRHVEVLKRAAERAGWGQPLPEGTALGIATNQGYTSFIAVVARVAKKDGVAHVEKLTCVVDCGLAVSPGGVEEQIYGGLMWGLGHALFDRMDIKQGRVVQSNFHDYRVTRMSDMPAVDILVLDGEPGKPGGVGELGSPSVAPAIANALFSLTGRAPALDAAEPGISVMDLRSVALLHGAGRRAAFRPGRHPLAHLPAAAEPADSFAGGGTRHAAVRAQSPSGRADRRRANAQGAGAAGVRTAQPCPRPDAANRSRPVGRAGNRHDQFGDGRCAATGLAPVSRALSAGELAPA